MELAVVSVSFIIVYVLILIGTMAIKEKSRRNNRFKLIVIANLAKCLVGFYELFLSRSMPGADMKVVLSAVHVDLACIAYMAMVSYIRQFLDKKIKSVQILCGLFYAVNCLSMVSATLKSLINNANGSALLNVLLRDDSLYPVFVFAIIVLYLLILFSSRNNMRKIELMCFMAFFAFGSADVALRFTQFSYFYGIGGMISVILCVFFLHIIEENTNDFTYDQDDTDNIINKDTREEQKVRLKLRKRNRIYMVVCAIAMIALGFINPFVSALCSEPNRVAGISGMILSLQVIVGIYMTVTGYRFGTRCALTAIVITLINTLIAIIFRGQQNAFAGLMQLITGSMAILLIYTYMQKKDVIFDTVITQAIVTFADMIDSRDKYTGGHSYRVSRYAALIADKLGYDEDEVRRVRRIGLLHDCGKLGISDAILNKEGKLTDDEYNEIKRHTTIGANMLKRFDFIEGMNAGALYHHERYDGKGYPQGLSGKDIPEIGRIIAVADAFDAMNSRRCYRDELSMDVIISEITVNKGKQFDPKMADIMINLIKRDREKIQAIVDRKRN